MRCQGDEDEYVKISRDSLPDNPYDVIYLLKVEFAPRSNWRDVAAAYFRLGKWQEGITVLEEATSDDVESVLRGDSEEAAGGRRCSRIDLLAALGGAHIMVAETQLGEASKREETLRKAGNVFSRADKIDLDEPSIWAARGWADLLAGKTASAKDWFVNAREKSVVLGAVGLAAVNLSKMRAPESGRMDAVPLLIGALRTKRCPPGAWTGLGYALFREGRFQQARNVARRAVRAVKRSSAGERLEALYLLALIETVDRIPSSVENMTIALREAYLECDGDRDPRILTLISELYFNGGDFENAANLAQRAVEIASDTSYESFSSNYQTIRKNILLQALFQLARAHHHLDKLDEAIKGFDKIKKMLDAQDGSVLKVNPGFYLRLGMLKVSTGRPEDETVAQECLEKVLRSSNDRSLVAMRALGFILGKRVLLGLRRGKPRGGETFHRAVSLLKKGLADQDGKRDIPAQLIYAGLVEEPSPEIAVDAYRTIVETLTEAGAGVDPEVWVNMSSLLGRIGQVEEARNILRTKLDPIFAETSTTVAYNRGRLAEMCNDEQDAIAQFRSIQQGQTHCAEAQVRLGAIAKDRGDHTEAEAMFKNAMNELGTKSVAAAFLSDLYATQKRFKEAQDVLEQTRSECDYLNLAFARFMHRFLDSLGTQERRNRFLINHIGMPLTQILKRSKHNAFAANAAGVYFAENNMIDEARDAFTAAGASQLAAKTARVNLAHTQMCQGRRLLRSATGGTGRFNPGAHANAKALFEQAEKLYRDALRAGDPRAGSHGWATHIELLHYIGCAQFEAEEYRSAAETMQRVLHFVPQSNATWSNLGLALYESAVSRIRGAKSSLPEILKAKSELEASQKSFSRALGTPRIRQVDSVTQTQFEPRYADQWYRFVRQETKRHEVAVVNARNDAEDREQRRKDKMMKLLEAMEKKREKEAERQELQLKRQRELEEAARAAAEKLREAEETDRLEKERMKLENELVDASDEYGYEDGNNTSEHTDNASRPKKRRRKSDLEIDGLKRNVKTNTKRSIGRLARKDEGSSDEYSDIGGDNDSLGLGEEADALGKPDTGDESNTKQSRPRRSFAIASDSDASEGNLD